MFWCKLNFVANLRTLGLRFSGPKLHWYKKKEKYQVWHALGSSGQRSWFIKRSDGSNHQKLSTHSSACLKSFLRKYGEPAVRFEQKYFSIKYLFRLGTDWILKPHSCRRNNWSQTEIVTSKGDFEKKISDDKSRIGWGASKIWSLNKRCWFSTGDRTNILETIRANIN